MRRVRERSIRRALLPLAAIGVVVQAGTGASIAACKIPSPFAVYQCGDRAYFDPPPEGSGAVTAVFWQIGYGNAVLNSGEGSSGTGLLPSGRFMGVDSGLLGVRLIGAREALRDDRVPEGAICLAPLSWADRGIDGCPDNVRDPNMLGPDDGMLNPRFDTRAFRKEGRIVETDDRIQDYPMAVLLREENGRYFAVAAVASAERKEAGDLRIGHFTFADVREGKRNPLTGAPNVIAWQSAPAPSVEVIGEGAAGAAPPWRVQVAWPPVSLPGDASHRPSGAYGIENPGGGVGVADMGSLVAYVVEKAHVSSGMIGPNGYPVQDVLLWEEAVETAENRTILEIEDDTCLRIAVQLGKRPRTRTVSVDNCALGRCGDIGYRVTGRAVCLEGSVLKGAGRGPGR